MKIGLSRVSGCPVKDGGLVSIETNSDRYIVKESDWIVNWKNRDRH